MLSVVVCKVYNFAYFILHFYCMLPALTFRFIKLVYFTIYMTCKEIISTLFYLIPASFDLITGSHQKMLENVSYLLHIIRNLKRFKVLKKKIVTIILPDCIILGQNKVVFFVSVVVEHRDNS